MIKKLDLLVLKAFIGPFIATFFLTLFVLILQFFWLWIDDFVGKGIDGLTILRLIIYLSATLVPLALPLAVLLSSIMTFGNLGETFELVAIKSAGIGLLRFMRSLLVTTILLAGLAFYFNNNVIPIANLKMKTLQYDLVNKKPAFDLKEGTFYNMIPGYSIKVAKKVNDSILNDIIIYESSPNVQDNMIAAKRGIMRMSDDKHSLEFTLQNGWRYEEEGERNSTNSRFYRLGFKEYKKVLDLSSLTTLNFTSDSVYKDRAEMLSIGQLNKSIDSLRRTLNQFHQRHKAELKSYLPFMQYIDSGWTKVAIPDVKKDTILKKDTLVKKDTVAKKDAVVKKDTGVKKDSATIRERLLKRNALIKKMAAARKDTAARQDTVAKKDTTVQKDTAVKKDAPVKKLTAAQQDSVAKRNAAAQADMAFRKMLPDSARSSVLDQSISFANSIKSTMEGASAEYENRRKELRVHLMTWHEKFTMSIAVLVLFLIGAPLGSIVRKGGIGTPVVFAVAFFVIFFLLNNFGRKFVKEDVLQPFAGMWLATIVLLPIGFFLIYKALHDSQLFNKEFYSRIIRMFRKKNSRKATDKLTSEQVEVTEEEVIAAMKDETEKH
ncbi:LptF/LptG family permease [Paraflavitalea soli]|uniref:LptF/LptG family permease n=1 Tax=Paraflavitalea soli TaxID=2315862 RepID=A0A3B7MNK3_9BACT|nr:LptF/LptG family permease [Paraflavitalea soli]AXY76062.1 LptF/LptG family permease [Paraflavitalea soli]